MNCGLCCVLYIVCCVTGEIWGGGVGVWGAGGGIVYCIIYCVLCYRGNMGWGVGEWGIGGGIWVRGERNDRGLVIITYLAV
jgi:hypothetical protein